MSVLQPVGQVRLTNVAYVRLTKKGKRFEIACYRNKVLNWRNKIEQDINEVLQVASVFTNVSKGTHASGKDLQQAFGTSDPVKVCEEILEKGDLQVSEKEREAMLESMFRDVASLVCEMTINPENGRQYSLSMIQNAMRQIHYSINLRSAKKQALDVIRRLRSAMPIVRAGMLIRLVCRPQDVAAVKAMLEEESKGVTIVSKHLPSTDHTATPSCDTTASTGADATVVPGGAGSDTWFEVCIDPEVYRRLEDSVRVLTEGMGRVEILQLRVSVAGGDGTAADIEDKDDVPSVDAVCISDRKEKPKKVQPSDGRGKGNRGNRDVDEEEDNDEGVGEEEYGRIAATKAMTARERKKEKKKKTVQSRKELEEEEGAVLPPRPPSPAAMAVAALEADAPKAEDAAATEPATIAVSTGKKCNTCGGSFESDAAYRLHFRSEWHRYNLKRKMKSLPVVTESEFAALPASETERTTDGV